MTATPPPSYGDNAPTGPGPDFDAASYGRYSASSGASASVPAATPDPTVYGQPAPAFGTPQPTPTSFGAPAQGPFSATPAYVDPYANQVSPNPYPATQGSPNPYPASQGYAEPYGGNQGYSDPNAAGPYAATQGYGTPGYPPNQAYAQPPQNGQVYPQLAPYPTYAMAPMMMGAPLPTGMGVAAMVCGICGLVLSLCGGWTIALSIVGIVLGAIGVQKANRRQAGGRSMAITGIVTGSIGVAISGVVIMFFIIAAIASR
jgi:Domain of unknown function (DUF4190)